MKESNETMNILRDLVLASKPLSFIMTAISVSVGGGLAAADGTFSWNLYLITVISAMLLHGATNLRKEYYAMKSAMNGMDTTTSEYQPNPLRERRLTAVQIRNVSLVLYGLVLVGGLYLAGMRGWPILILGVIGAAAGLFYRIPPFRYKYSTLGECSVFLIWGPLMVEGAYYVQRQQFSQEAFWISIPFGVLVALVLLSNNIRDIARDRKNAIRTLPILIGKENGIRLYATLIIMAYLAILVMSLIGLLHLWSLIVLASIPLAFRLLRQMEEHVPEDADARTAQFDTAFGVLLVLSLVLENLI